MGTSEGRGVRGIVRELAGVFAGARSIMWLRTESSHGIIGSDGMRVRHYSWPCDM